MHIPQTPAREVILAALAVPLLTASCGDDGGTTMFDAGTEGGVHAVFELAPDPMPFGAIPFPDDLYLDETGRIALGELPGEAAVSDSAYQDSLRVGLSDLDGFGVVTPTYFYFDGALDVATLPPTPEMSLLEHSTVFMVNVDPDSSYVKLPVEVRFRAEDRELAVRPANGHPLRAGGRYAVVVTTSVHGADGLPVAPAERFALVRDARTRPSDPLLGEAHDHYSEVLATLATTGGLVRETVAALALFAVQSVTDDLVDAREGIWDRAVPAVTLTAATASGTELDALLGSPSVSERGLDVDGGVIHDAIGWMIHGTFPSPWLLSPASDVHGRFQRDDDSELIVHRSEDVPFTLFLPRASVAGLPVAIYQHGLGGERSDALAFANDLCGEGYAVLAMDVPWHGMRNVSDTPDTTSRFTGESTPDGFGDVRGLGVVVDFAGITDAAGELGVFHPNYLRDALRQATVDLMSLVRLVREGDWSEVAGEVPGLEALSFAAEPLSLIGYSLGGIIATQLAAIEPEIGVAVLGVTGGSLMNIVSESPIYNRGYYPLLLPLLGVAHRSIDYENDHPRFMPELAIWQTLLDRGDSIAYARTLSARPISILMPMARHDENLHNVGTESLARALDAQMINDEPLYADVAIAESPLRDNVSVGGEMVTRAVYVWAPATHGLLQDRRGESVWAHPITPPFTAAEDPTRVDNPIDDAMSQIMHFLQSFRTGTAEVSGPR